MTFPSRFLLAAFVAVSVSSPLAAQGGFIPPASGELIAAITTKDKELFDAVFETCDPKAVTSLVAEDFEFYHDKSGQPFNSGSQWVKALNEMCERQKQGTDYRARRELDAASSKVYPINNYGALHTGTHRFYKKLPDGKEQLVEVSLFSNLWKNENGSWKLTRVLSYDHRDAR
jgi:ketosteroid isomerase-like protein